MYKVFLVDDEYRVKERLLNLTDWVSTPFAFCGEASDGEMALSQINELKPDIVITDIQMPFMDGLELSTILKSTMPWIQIIIISGYDDFKYAKEALKIGISDYLLKPIKLEELNKVLTGVMQKIDEEKQQSIRLLQMENKLNRIEEQKKDILFEMLISSNFDTKEIIQQYRELDVNIISKFYIVIDVKICGTNPLDYLAVKSFCNIAIVKIKNAILYYKTPDKLLIILYSNEQQQLIEQAFGLAGVIKHEVSKIENHRVIIGIGNVVDRLRNVSLSYINANKARSYINEMHIGQILYIEDVEKKLINTEPISNTKEYDQLSRLEIEDVEEFLVKILSEYDKEETIQKYLEIYNILFQCTNIITKLGGLPSQILPKINDQQIINLVRCGAGQIKDTLKQYVTKMIVFRNENSVSKYYEIIRKAKEYIHNHYSNSGLSLNEVAKHVCISPNHFSMIFSNETETTFIEFLTKTRINNAKKLLLCTDLKLSIITNHVGYNEPQYFSYIFKKNTGMSPSDFRLKENL